MKRGPYRVFTPWLFFTLIPVGVAVAIWVAVGIAGLPEEVSAMIVLIATTAGFVAIGAVPGIYVIVVRGEFYNSIVAQDSRWAIVSKYIPGYRQVARDMVRHKALSKVYKRLEPVVSFGSFDDLPFLVVKLQDGLVEWKWGSIKRMAQGTASGIIATVSIQPTVDGTVRLIAHELGHLILIHCSCDADLNHHDVMEQMGLSEVGISELATGGSDHASEEE